MKYFLSFLIIFFIYGVYPINVLAQSDEDWRVQQIQLNPQSQQNLSNGAFTTLPHKVSSDAFIKDLIDRRLLDPINDASSINFFQSICSSVHISSLNQNLNTFCEIIVASEICQAIENKDDLLQCNDFSRSKSLNPIEFLAGCTEGLFDSVGEIISFVWEVLKVIGSTLLSPIDTATQAVHQNIEYLNSVKLYLQTEYERAYQEARSPKRLYASVKVAFSIAPMLIKLISDALYQGYQQFECLNARAKTEAICQVAGEIFVPPIAAINLFKVGIRGIRTVDKLDTFIRNERRRLGLSNDLSRLRQQLAEDVLGRQRPLSRREAMAIQAAHKIGEGQLGRDGTPAGIGNYTNRQLRDKVKILRDAGFSRGDRRKLIQSGLIGIGKKQSQVDATNKEVFEEYPNLGLFQVKKAAELFEKMFKENSILFHPKFKKAIESKSDVKREYLPAIYNNLYNKQSKLLANADGLREIRIKRGGGIRIYFFFNKNSKRVFVYAKSSKNTQDRDIKNAKKYKKEYEQANSQTR